MGNAHVMSSLWVNILCVLELMSCLLAMYNIQDFKHENWWTSSEVLHIYC